MTVVAGLAAALTAGCQTAPEQRAEPGEVAAYTFPAEVYRPGARQDATLYRLDPAASDVRVLVYRGGALASAGHNHVIVPGALQGALWLPQSGLDDARLDVAVPVKELRVDPTAAREAVGGSFSGTVGAEARQGTRENMLGPAGLDAAAYPTLGLRVMDVAGELPRPILQVQVCLHGRRHTVTVPAEVSVEGGELRARGRFAVRQSWFGIEPFSALGGALRVQDWLMVEFDVLARADE